MHMMTTKIKKYIKKSLFKSVVPPYLKLQVPTTMDKDWTTVQRQNKKTSKSFDGDIAPPPPSPPSPQHQPTVRSANRGIAWRVPFENNTSTITSKRKKPRLSSSKKTNKRSTGSSTATVSNSRTNKTNASNSAGGLRAVASNNRDTPQQQLEATADDTDDTDETDDTDNNISTPTATTSKSSSFAAAARRGNITQRNLTGPRPTKMTRGGGTRTTAGGVRRKVNVLTEEQEKKLEERRAKERGRKLLLALSSGNLDDFPSLIPVEEGSGEEVENDDLNATNRSIASNTTEIAWDDNSNNDNSKNHSNASNGGAFKGSEKSENDAFRHCLDINATPYDPPEGSSSGNKLSRSGPAGSSRLSRPAGSAPHKTSLSQSSIGSNGSNGTANSNSVRDTTKQRMMRQKLWGVLFSNVNRTVDEVYYFCEFESDEERTQEAIELLDNWRIDFQALLEGFQRQTEFSARSLTKSFTQQQSEHHDVSEEDLMNGENNAGSVVPGQGLRRRRFSSSSRAGVGDVTEEEVTNKGGVAWDVKKSSPQHTIGAGPSNSGIRAALRTVSPPRQARSSARGMHNHGTTTTTTTTGKQTVIRIEEFEASCSTLDQPVRLNVVLEKHHTDRKLWADICDEEDEANGIFDNSSAVGGQSTAGETELSALESSTDSTGSRVGGGHVQQSHSVKTPTSPDSGENGDSNHAVVANNSGRDRSFSNRSVDSMNNSERDRKSLHKSLHAKLSSPDRRKPSPLEAKRKLNEKQHLAQINRERLDNVRMAKLRKSTDRLRDATARRQRRLRKTETSMLKRLEESESRRVFALRNKARRAGSENSKVEEVTFIKSLKEEDRRRELKEKLEEGEARRDEIIGRRQQRQRDHHAKVETAMESRRKRSEEEGRRVRASLERRGKAAEMRRLENLKTRQAHKSRLKEKEERVQKNKDKLEERRLQKMEARKRRMWTKVVPGRRGGAQVTTDDEDLGASSAGGSAMSGIDHDDTIEYHQQTTPARAGVDVMPCLLASSQGKNSPMTPPTSPQSRSHSRLQYSALGSVSSSGVGGGNETEDSDVGGGGSGVGMLADANNSSNNRRKKSTSHNGSNPISRNLAMRSPRKQFRTALLNGETIDVASNMFDAAESNNRTRRDSATPVDLQQPNDIDSNMSVDDSQVENFTPTVVANNRNQAGITKKKKKKKNKKNGKNKNNNGRGKSRTRQKKKGDREAKSAATPSASASAATINPAHAKMMRKRAKKLKDRLKKIPWRKSRVSFERDEGDDEGNDEHDEIDRVDADGVVAEEEGEEQYDVTWEEGAAMSLKKSRSHLYALHTEMMRVMDDMGRMDDIIDDEDAFEGETTYQHDGRMLRSILQSLSALIAVTSNHVRIRRKENGWDNLVQCGGVELLARYAYQGVSGSADGSAKSSAKSGTKSSSTTAAISTTIDAKADRRARTACLALLTVLVEQSASAAYSLVSTGGLLVVMSEGTSSLRRELAGVDDGQYVNEQTVCDFHTNLANRSLSIFSTVLEHAHRSGDGTSLLEWPSGVERYLIEYSGSVAMWSEMSELIHQCAASRGGVLTETRQNLLRLCLKVVETSVMSLYSNKNGDGGSNDPNVTAVPPLVFEALAETGIKALLHLVEALADSQKVRDSRNGKEELFNRHVGSPVPFVGTTLQALGIMLDIAKHNIDVLHTASNDVGIRNEMYHVFSFLLEWCISEAPKKNGVNSETSDLLLERTICLMGYYARGSTERQQSLHWGSHPTPLQRLCNLPFRFFSLESSKEILFPTLICICNGDVRNRSVVEDEISTQMLHKFIEDRTKEETSSSFRTRFPKTMWKDSLDFFESE